MIDNRIKIINDICKKVNINNINEINKNLNFEETILKIYDEKPNEQLEYVSNFSFGFIFKGYPTKKENCEASKYRLKIILYPKIDLISKNIYNNQVSPQLIIKSITQD